MTIMPTTKAVAYLASIVAVAKAAGVPELIQILDLEIGLRDALIAAHAAAAEAAIKVGVEAVKIGGHGSVVADHMGPVYTSKLLEQARKVVPVAVDAIYRLAKDMAWRRCLQRKKAPALDPIDNPPVPLVAVAKASKPKPVEIGPSIDLVDEKAIKACGDLQLHWIGDHWGDNLQARIEAITQQMINEGLGADDLHRQVADVLRREMDLSKEAPYRPIGYEVPAGWTGSDPAYWEMLAGNATTVARVAGTIQAMTELKVTRITINNPIDKRTCTRCALLDGKEFTITQAKEQLDRLLAADSKTAVKAVAPWLSSGAIGKLTDGPGHVSDADSAALAAAGVCLPPFHGSCRCAVDIAESATVGED